MIMRWDERRPDPASSDTLHRLGLDSDDLENKMGLAPSV